MKLKDLTESQAIEIARLAYDTSSDESLIQEDKGFAFKHYPVNPAWYEDGYEHTVINFHAVTFGDTVDKIHLDIYPNLNVTIGYVRPMKENSEVGMIHSLPLRNQYQIFKKFVEWELEPE